VRETENLAFGPPFANRFGCYHVSQNVILDSANADLLSLDHQIRSSSIFVLRLANAARIRDGHLSCLTYLLTPIPKISRIFCR
jgi:hypothetical protein